MDRGSGQMWLQRLADQEIVDPPAHVPLSRLRHHVPPGVRLGCVRMQVAERVDKAVIQEILKPLALLVREAVRAMVLIWSGEVDLLVGDIEVATKDDWLRSFAAVLSRFKLLDERQEGWIPCVVA